MNYWSVKTKTAIWVALSSLAIAAIYYMLLSGRSSRLHNEIESGQEHPRTSETALADDDHHHDRNETEPANRNKLTFPDHESLKFKWRDQPMPSDIRGEPPYLDDYGRLEDLAAEGNSDAAVYLYDLVTNCSRAYVSKEDLNQAIELAYQSHQIKLANMKKPRQMAETSDIQSWVESGLREPFEACEGITAEQRSEGTRWMEIAADLGDSLAAIEFGREIAETDYERSVDYLTKAWQQGNLDALPFLAQQYGQKYQSGEEPEFQVRAYAMYYAYNYLLQEGMRGHGKIANQWAESNFRDLRHLEGTLHQYEIEEGRRIAAATIIENSNCCYGM